MRQDSFDMLIEMETKFHLFDLKERDFFPLWDFLRVEVYNNKINRDVSVTVANRAKIVRFRNLFWKLIHGIICRRNIDYAFFYCPRFIDNQGYYYDRMAENLLEYAAKYKCLCINIEGEKKLKHKSCSMSLFNVLARIKTNSMNMNINNYNIIHHALLETFGIDLSYDILNGIYRGKIMSYYSYLYFLHWVRPKKVFVSLDLQKGCYLAAKQLGIPTCEIQHGLLLYRYSSYSYPRFIDNNSNIAFADYFASPGDGWGINTNVPCRERLVLGNSNFVLDSGSIHENGSILIISNLEHCQYLVPFAIQLSQLCSNKILYKLHPSEYSHFNYYKDEFKDATSIEVVPVSSSISECLMICSIMITISSTAFFEAVSSGKRVAVLKLDNYYILEEYIDRGGVFLVEKPSDIVDVMNMPICEEKVEYYKPFDNKVADFLLN